MARRPAAFGGRLLAVLAALAAALACLLGLATPARAQSMESVLRPGELVQSHAKWEDECAACHVRFDRAAQNARCMDCHKPIGRDVRERTGFHGRLKPQPCRSCHTDHKGRQARIAEFDTRQFDHAQTDFVLGGRHRNASCTQCHTAGRKYSEAPSDCKSCHGRDDVHKGGLGSACGDCHDDGGWKRTRFDHGRTRFALSGRHAQASCDSCHRQQVYKDTPRSCIGCHRKEDDAPRGHQGRYGERCDSCHGTQGWKPSTFNHDTDTRYALRGRHRNAACNACHTAPLFKVRPAQACADCHAKDDTHRGSLGAECQACHAERDWKETSRFDHDRSAFVLLGRHRDARCEACHAGGRYRGTPAACIDCHRRDDTHKGQLGAACGDCHVERTWKEASRFDHQRSRFALQGRHATVRCGDCHADSRYRDTPSDCIACHRKDDRHAGNLGTDCASCHDAQRWDRSPGFSHQRTRFALRHAHAAPAVTCVKCHADLRSYRGTPTACNDCHRRDDRHEGQLGTRCDSCHDDARWKPARFDHAKARFPLVGSHGVVPCASCHTSARYRDAPRECVGCHRKEDSHQARFGENCASCHNARAWRSWTFNHDTRTRYPLDGAHRSVGCERCHTAPAPRGQSIAAVGTACVGCHQRDDRHDGGFGAQCERCHVTTHWKHIGQRSGAFGDPRLALGGQLGWSSWFLRPEPKRRAA